MDSCITWCLESEPELCEIWAFFEENKICVLTEKALTFDGQEHTYAKGVVSGKKSCKLLIVVAQVFLTIVSTV